MLKNEVDNYIFKAPKEAQPKLKELRKLILAIAPKTEESISYKMPYYSYKGRLVWFAARKGYVGLYLRPPIIDYYKKELAGYVTTKSAVHFSENKKLPITLIKKLITARLKRNELEYKAGS